MKKYYFSHPISNTTTRKMKWLMRWANKIKDELGVELIIPKDDSDNWEEVVNWDLDNIRRSNGIIVYADNNISTWGCPMEVWEGWSNGLPIWVITSNLKDHFWINWVTNRVSNMLYENNKSGVFKTFRQFIEWYKGNNNALL